MFLVWVVVFAVVIFFILPTILIIFANLSPALFRSKPALYIKGETRIDLEPNNAFQKITGFTHFQRRLEKFLGENGSGAYVGVLDPSDSKKKLIVMLGGREIGYVGKGIWDEYRYMKKLIDGRAVTCCVKIEPAKGRSKNIAPEVDISQMQARYAERFKK